MIGRSSIARVPLVLAVAGALLGSTGAFAAPIRVEIVNYLVSVGDADADYFDGKLLTAHDLTQEQSYERSADRYIGETEQPLDVVLEPAGRADLVLLFDESDALFDNRSDVEDGNESYDEDFIVLDPLAGTWRGRLFVGGVTGVEEGIYDDLFGHFESLVLVAEPAILSLFVLGLAGMAARRVERRA